MFYDMILKHMEGTLDKEKSHVTMLNGDKKPFYLCLFRSAIFF
jgi:hypothetical protein